MSQRVILAYSGGLDTSVAVRWMMETRGVEVVAVAVDVGQASEPPGDDWEAIRQPGVGRRMLWKRSWWTPGLRWPRTFVCPPSANANYEGKYPLVSALSARSS